MRAGAPGCIARRSFPQGPERPPGSKLKLIWINSLFIHLFSSPGSLALLQDNVWGCWFTIRMGGERLHPLRKSKGIPSNKSLPLKIHDELAVPLAPLIRDMAKKSLLSVQTGWEPWEMGNGIVPVLPGAAPCSPCPVDNTFVEESTIQSCWGPVKCWA